MGLQVFYPTDIRDALLAAEQATTAAGANGQYLTGYRAALLTMALAFGLGNGDTVLDGASHVQCDRGGLLCDAPAWRPVALASE